jgi:formylglycine-generating enzyme required for sulfatase activity
MLSRTGGGLFSVLGNWMRMSLTVECMQKCILVCAGFGLLLTPDARNLQGSSGQKPDNNDIERLIRQLGSDEFTKREAASKQLDSLGDKAVTALRKAATTSDDPEIRRRAQQVLDTIAERARTAAAATAFGPVPGKWQFVKVPKGTFWMGGGRGRPPTRQVEIKEDFELAAYVVTQGQWQAIMGNNPSHFSRKGGGKDKVQNVTDADLERFPVEQVSWVHVQDFLKKVNEMEKGKGWLYRLPSEAEWEYACRNALTTKEQCSFDYYFDKPTNALSSKQANFDGRVPAGNAERGPSLGRPTKVGSYAPNRLGLYDMHGNVYQWCADLWEGSDTKRVVRGSSWNLPGVDVRAGDRRWSAPTLRAELAGFLGIRLARVPLQAK